jgi:hypothetical protein
VDETEEVLRGMGARVEKRVYPGMGHTVNRDELDWVAAAMRELATGHRRESTELGVQSG